jgi:dihydrofolate reductase
LTVARNSPPNLARQLISADLVDQLLLMIEPIVLGGGKRLFPEDGEARNLQLMSASTTGTGVQICTRRRAGA